MKQHGWNKRVWVLSDFSWYCTCAQPAIGAWGACMTCHRKPHE